MSAPAPLRPLPPRPLPSRSTRRLFSAVALSLTAALALSACGGGTESTTSAPSGTAAPSGGQKLSGRIVWADFGGPTNKARQTTYFDGFTGDTGVEVVSTVEEDALADTMLNGGAGDYDAMHVGLDYAYRYKDNILSRPAGATLDQQLPEDIRDKAWGTFLVGHAQGYLTSTFPNGGPQTWADFWDVKKFPGKRAWPGTPGSYDSTCEVALLADGVAADQLYPLDLDRCTKKLNELRPNMVFYNAYPEIQQLIASGTAAVALGPSGQYAALRNGGQDVTVSWNQAVVAPNVMVTPAKAPNPDNIFALAEWMSDPKRQAEFAKLTGYGPGNPDAFQHMTEETLANIVSSPSHDKIVWQNSRARAEQRDALLAWYTGWLAQ
ncbi:ABC transporter substrate-binding protein [Acrocarpospora macrocephala]|uniref:ABC transporter substrate-binding protein n=1 Tax=Acrocarpospora macrocephala TaxID=150177 RepID=A0A5M3WQC2_9ACTN|nr:extracellular solute-binding protein [Acrocarpospora macrocephala]GES11557.1 ABC transporter substrate-binding protein [Acrocarpospora macrocephala]